MRNTFELISPLDFRYAKGKLFEKAKPFLSEEARIKYCLEVEAAYVKALAEKGICSKAIAEEVELASKRINAEQVYREEEKTKHDVKALVNCLKAAVSEEAKPFIHLGLTSYDVVDTANSLRYKHFVERVLLPELKALEKELIKLALEHKRTLQIGRTHGQFAEPITFGFALAYYVERLGNRIVAIEAAKEELAGKISGAVGAYNAISLFCDRPEELEQITLKILGLKQARCSTQIAPREPLVDLMNAIISMLGVLANLADDIRHLQRSEIAEVAEFFGSEQVGSSTMPHKRNPISFENIKSFWKAFMPRMLTIYMDQISEHQRDLSNSASSRFTQEILFASYYASNRMLRAISKLYVDSKAMRKNFEKAKDKIIAEPLYVLLSLQGLSDAHERIKRLALKANNKNLLELAMNDPELKPYMQKIAATSMLLLKNPEKYIGIAEQKTTAVCEYWEKKLGL